MTEKIIDWDFYRETTKQTSKEEVSDTKILLSLFYFVYRNSERFDKVSEA